MTYLIGCTNSHDKSTFFVDEMFKDWVSAQKRMIDLKEINASAEVKMEYHVQKLPSDVANGMMGKRYKECMNCTDIVPLDDFADDHMCNDCESRYPYSSPDFDLINDTWRVR